MGRLMRKRQLLTEGERARVLAFLLVGVCSAGIGYLAVLHLNQSALFEAMSRYEKWVVAASGIGGLLALYLAGDRLGQPGRAGALRAIAGGVWVTFIGALIGGTLGLPLYGTMFGPFIVVVTLLGSPILGMLWVTNLVGVHILLGVYQRERDSIFTAKRMTLHDHPDGLKTRFQGRFT